MLKEYNKLWVFGDSYTTPDVGVSPSESFWGLTAAKLGIDTIINCSRISNSFTSIQHLLVGMSEQINWVNDLVLIVVPPLERITVFDNYKDTEYLGHQINTDNWAVNKFDIPTHRGLMSLQNYGTDRQLILHNDRSWLETDTLRQVFLLTAWLDSNHANYVVVNCSKPLDTNNVWGPSNFVLPYAMNHSKCILFKNTYYDINYNVNKPADFDQYGWHGHHGPEGNKHFFENSLLPTMQRNNFC